MPKQITYNHSPQARNIARKIDDLVNSALTPDQWNEVRLEAIPGPSEFDSGIEDLKTEIGFKRFEKPTNAKSYEADIRAGKPVQIGGVIDDENEPLTKLTKRLQKHGIPAKAAHAFGYGAGHGGDIDYEALVIDLSTVKDPLKVLDEVIGKTEKAAHRQATTKAKAEIGAMMEDMTPSQRRALLRELEKEYGGKGSQAK